MEDKQNRVDREADGGFRVGFRVRDIEGDQNERVGLEEKERVG